MVEGIRRGGLEGMRRIELEGMEGSCLSLFLVLGTLHEGLEEVEVYR